MSIFNYKYVDKILLHHCSWDIDLYYALKCLNKYYYNIINIMDNYNSWILLLDHNKRVRDYPKNFKNNLFINACEKGNMEICNYLINKFNDIDIHTRNEHAFQLSCKNGYLEVAKWLIDLGMQKNFTPIDIHADDDLAFQWSCERNHLEVAKWLFCFGLKVKFTLRTYENNELYFQWNSRSGGLWNSSIKLHGKMIEWLRTIEI